MLDIKHAKQDTNHDLLNNHQTHDNLLNSNNGPTLLLETHTLDFSSNNSKFSNLDITQPINPSSNIFDHL